MFDWIKRATGRAGTTLSLVSPFLQNVIWTMRRGFIELGRDAYNANSIVSACLRELTRGVAEPPLLAYQMGADQTVTPLDYNHPLSKLIRNPNPLQTEYQFIKLGVIHASLGGRFVVWKQRDNVGRIKYLWPLRPDRVGPIYAPARDPNDPESGPDPAQPVICGWAYVEPGMGTPKRLPLEDVAVWHLPDPTGETGGLVEALAPLTSVLRDIEIDNEATSFAGALLKNSATPGVVIQTKVPELDRKTAKDIKWRFLNQFGGIRRGEPAVIDGNTTITQLGYNLQQLDFSGLRHGIEARVSAVTGVPAILAGLEVGLYAGIKATTNELREQFAEGTLSSWWRDLSDGYTKYIAAEFGDDLFCRFDMTKVKALAVQLAAQYQPLVEGFKNGAVTVDEYRVKVLQLPPLNNVLGDSMMISAMAVATLTGEDETFLDPTEDDDEEVSGKARKRRPFVKAASRHWLAAHKADGAQWVTIDGKPVYLQQGAGGGGFGSRSSEVNGGGSSSSSESDPTKPPAAVAGGKKPAKKPPKQAASGGESSDPREQPPKLTPVEGKVFTGDPVPQKESLSKQDAGKIGENIVLAYLQQVEGRTEATHANTEHNNFPVDLVDGRGVIEVKTGNIANGKDAQKWRLTIGQPGKAETAANAALDADALKALNADKQKAILARKQAVIEGMAKALGRPIEQRTMTVILNHDARKADLYAFQGFHDRIGWTSTQAKEGYVGTYQY